MISGIPWIFLLVALAVVLALFIVLKSFKMPSSFEENQQKRMELRKKNATSREITDKK